MEPGNRPAKRQESPEESSMTLDAQPYGTLNGQAVPRSVAMKLTGHLTESIYRRYAIVCEADLAAGMKKLAALHRADTKALRFVRNGHSLGTIPSAGDKTRRAKLS